MFKSFISAAILALLSFGVVSNQQPTEMFWDELLPDDFVLPEQQALSHDGAPSIADQSSISAPVREELNGKFVRIPGFVVPLEGDELITEFLLVPYFGACVHAPPPPPNQIIHVVLEKGAPIDELYDAVWLTGTLSTDSWTGDIAQVGYRMKGLSVSPYDE